MTNERLGLTVIFDQPVLQCLLGVIRASGQLPATARTAVLDRAHMQADADDVSTIQATRATFHPATEHRGICFEQQDLLERRASSAEHVVQGLGLPERARISIEDKPAAGL